MDVVDSFNLPVDDMERAKRFYEEVFGWEISVVLGSGGNYHAATTVPVDEKGQPKVSRGGINGGLFQRGTHGLEGISLEINVSSIDECLKKIEAVGGKTVMPKAPILNFGFFALFMDTECNIIGLWEDAK